MKKQQHHKIISTILILAFAICLLTCGEEDSGDLGLMWIPDGAFWMGSSNGTDTPGNPPPAEGNTGERPRHEVTLTKGFYMSRYPITQSQYYLVTGEKPSSFKDDGRGRLPVERVSWYEAIVFCNKLSIKHGLQPVYSISGSTNPADWGPVPTSSNDKWNAVEMIGDDFPNDVPNGYRLPTEAEWEYACRAGTTTPYNKDWDPLYDPPEDAPGWYSGNCTSTQEVGLKPPNAWGLYDMHGNVYEWCWDKHTSTYYSEPEATYNPKGPITSGSTRVIRGGNWGSGASDLRSAYRSTSSSAVVTNNTGFRVVRP